MTWLLNGPLRKTTHSAVKRGTVSETWGVSTLFRRKQRVFPAAGQNQCPSISGLPVVSPKRLTKRPPKVGEHAHNAYYSLARRESILPHSIVAIAEHLNVAPGDVMTEDSPKMEKANLLLAKTDRDNIRHTLLLLLTEEPIDRLRRALICAQGSDIR